MRNRRVFYEQNSFSKAGSDSAAVIQMLSGEA
jgi:hypothetical protein